MQVAVLDEDNCVGCTKCISVCPVDAIIGAPQQLHVILTDRCIGCGLCLPPCPTSCLTLAEAPTGIMPPKAILKENTKKYAKARKARLKAQGNAFVPQNMESEISLALNRAANKQKKDFLWQAPDE